MKYSVIRPNGKRYVPQKGMAVAEFDDIGGGGTGIAVLRTHDVTAAVQFAMSHLLDFDLDFRDYSLDWWRLMYQRGDRRWVTDEIRGVPCIVWMPR